VTALGKEIMDENDHALLDGQHNGNTISLQTWEDACAESQAWADKARRKAYFRRLRHRAYGIIVILILLLIFGLLIVFITSGS
jgi:hypothetical protein